MADRIKMTPVELRDGAQNCELCRDQILSEIQTLNQRITQMYGNWEGLSQQAFIERFNEFANYLRQQTPAVLDGVAMKLRVAADTIEDADRQISQAFRG